jgi:release factor glutamine methyltransferase
LSNREARAEIDVLVARVLGIGRARLIAHPELAEAAAADAVYRAALARRLRGEPVAYILGVREFYGLEFEVSPAVLIPRPETELLVECALERLPAAAPARVLDVGTGSGCIAVCIARARPQALVVATDVSADALALAARNAARQGANNLALRLGAGFKPVAGERFDLVVSNPPYIAAGDPHLRLGDLRFEPQRALTPGSDGMALLRQLAADAPKFLLPGGWLVLEHGHDQADAVSDALAAAGLREVFGARDLAGLPRVAGARLLTLKS